MTARLERLLGRTPGQRRGRIAVILAAVIAVPLGVAGIVSGAIGGDGSRLEAVPAIVVNNDTMVTMTGADGEETPILAGRQLVTELTSPDVEGFRWTISNSDEAAAALRDGGAYAVLTIPSDFSASVTSLSGDAPTQADLSIVTDDAHAYLAGSVAQSVGDAMSTAFGREITAQYLTGFYENLAGVGGSLSDAADGATQISSGVSSLASGLGELSAGTAEAASGAAGAASGARDFASGVTTYTQGVDTLAGGVGQLQQQAGGLSGLTDGVSSYVGNVAAASAGYAQLSRSLQPLLALDPSGQAAAGVAEFGQGLSALAAGGDQLVAGTAAGVSELQGGIGQLATGAQQLSAGSAAVRDGGNALASGVSELASGLDTLATGTSASATGAQQLSGGATELASGLTTGAEQASVLGDIDAEATADVVAEPVTVSAERENPIDSLGGVVGVLFLPVSLWIGALAIFLVFRPVTVPALQSTASTARIVGRGLLRAGLVALAQVVAVVALLHTALGVSWTLLPQTLAFAAVIALAFTAVHYVLTVWLGRAGLIVSLVLLTLQIIAAGGLYPVEMLSAPVQFVSPLLPLTWAVSGMQAIISGAGGAAASAALLVVLALVAALIALAVVGKKRGARSFGFAAAVLG
ncbi:YhgE/Pip family protein [Agromyces atrinae]|uniref:Putative membrane protein n=1 Tax=Agromyces atrinae TaxID=592376 RepID=A0A4Q2M8R6_9MICO|nr:YhgE/Pip family protein [Agromyces atrinae]NYD65672.1 putative membrane protein [Agromyces atrinae]RXZ85470.1 YhgE/Pip domain-containing protein [Agromyces atrinae]